MSDTPLPSVFTVIATNGPGSATWDAEEVKRAICPDHVASLLREWKVPVTGKRSQKGWLECHAIDREDTAASAGVNLANGTYKDQGGEKLTCSIFDLAIRVGAFPDFPSAVNALGRRFNVTPKSGNLGTLGEPSTPKARNRPILESRLKR